MELETKILSKEIQQYFYDINCTVSTAESCTGGRIATAIIAVPGASDYFKGGIVSYTNEVKENLLHVSHETLEQESPVSEAVAKQMVAGACSTLHTDYAIAVTGCAGPSGGTPEIPVGTIWIACGNASEVHTLKLDADYGRDINLAVATNHALRLFIDLLKEKYSHNQDEK